MWSRKALRGSGWVRVGLGGVGGSGWGRGGLGGVGSVWMGGEFEQKYFLKVQFCLIFTKSQGCHWRICIYPHQNIIFQITEFWKKSIQTYFQYTDYGGSPVDGVRRVWMG